MQGVFIPSSKDPRFRACILKLRQSKEQRGTLSDSRQAHNCHPQICQPESDPVACNVFMCRYGSIHLCTEEQCGLYGGTPNGVCPISGIQHSGLNVSGYVKDKPHTWYRQHEERHAQVQTLSARFLLSGEEGKEEEEEEEEEQHIVVITKKRIRKKSAYSQQLTHEQIESAASKMVKLLLYSPERRAFIQKCIQRNLQLGEDAKAQYIQQQYYEEHQLPYACDMYIYKAFHSCKPLPLKEFAFDVNLHNYYVFVIAQVWSVVQRFHVPKNQKRYEGETEIVPRLNFDAVALATLYLMRKGHRQKNVELLPADDFLLLNLPHVNIYNEFGLEKSLVTAGDKLITDAYENALQENTPVAEIVLDMEKMPIRETYQVVRNEQGQLLKISSSGEKLFMPSSRKKVLKK